MLLDLYPYRASASSGIRRLMMYQLQEEALYPVKKVEKRKPILTSVIAEKEQPQPKVKVVKKSQVVESDEPLSIPKFRLKPVILPKEQEIPDNFTWLLSIELQQMLLEIQPHLIICQLNQVKINQQAANDADIRLRLLLLAA